MTKSAFAKRCLMTSSALAVSVLMAAPAMAQTAAEPTALDEIIVTARKREESIQRVPGSIAALSGQDLADRGVRDFEDFARIVPGVSFTTSGGDGIRPVIRGVTTQTGSPTTAIYLDDAPIQVRGSFRGVGGAADIKLVDIDRIEVLRGPQGTLYGGSSMGGAIKYVTKQPSLTERELVARGEVGLVEDGDPSYVASFTAGIPLVEDKVGFRGSVLFQRDGGWIERVDPVTGDVVDENVDEFNFFSGHAALLFKPTDALSITASYFGQHKEAEQLSYSDSAYGIGEIGNVKPETAEETFHLAQLKATADLGFAELFTQVSYFDRSYSRAEDYTLAFGDFGLGFWGPFSNGAEQEQKAWTGEARLSSTGDGPFSWTVGGYYYNNKLFSEQTIIGDAAPDLVFRSENTARDRQFAVFGEAAYRFLDSLTLTLGARYSWVEVKTIRYSEGIIGGGDAATIVRKEESFDPKVNLAWQFADEGLAYLQAAKGFRPGQGTAPLPDSCDAELQSRGISDSGGFDSDKLWTYEAGLKVQSPGGRARANAAVYQTDWTDKPEVIVLQSCGFGATLPVGSVRIRGFEFESSFAPIDQLRLGLNVGYTDAEFQSDEPTASIYEGDRLPGYSPWTVAASAEYRFPVAGNEATFRLDYTWRQSFYVEVPSLVNASTSERKTDSYGQLNARLSYEAPNWTTYVYVQNIANELPVVSREALYPASALSDRISSLRPRTIGIGVTRSF